jgi:transcriptional regulator with XRE-family HTH domain
MKAWFNTLAGAQLRVLRRSRGWSRRDVDDHMRWPPGTLRYLERGKVTLTLDHAAQIGSLYEYGLAELVESVGAASGGEPGQLP